MQFNEYLRGCRDKYGLTQEDLVNDLYIHDIESFSALDGTTLSKWERNLIKPRTSKQVSIIKYFQKQSDVALPCWDGYSVEEAEKRICQVGMNNLIGKSKHYLYDFPSGFIKMDDLTIQSVRNSEQIDIILEINMDVHKNLNHEFTRVTMEQFKEWSLHPYNAFYTCDYKGTYMGHFFFIRLKSHVFEKILNFEMRKDQITVEDFASFEESGSELLLSFFAANNKSATALFIRFYAHLIAHQRNIKEVGGLTKIDEAKKAVKRMNLLEYKNMTTEDDVAIESYRQDINNTLASEHVVKMILSKQDCPDEE